MGPILSLGDIWKNRKIIGAFNGLELVLGGGGDLIGCTTLPLRCKRDEMGRKKNQGTTWFKDC